jgi:HPt (histidine-containing phosphotransfer) domain-containing protein
MEIRKEALHQVVRLGGLNLLDRLIETALANLRQRLDELHAAAGAGDWERANRAAHSLKGSCGYLGLVELEALAAAAELHASQRATDWPQTVARIPAGYIDRARSALAVARAEVASEVPAG